jgi:hypothetical protein
MGNPVLLRLVGEMEFRSPLLDRQDVILAPPTSKFHSMIRGPTGHYCTFSTPPSSSPLSPEATFNPAYLLCLEIPPSPMLSKVSLMGFPTAFLVVWSFCGSTVGVSLFHCMDSSHPPIGRAPLIMKQNRPRLPIRPQNDVL